MKTNKQYQCYRIQFKFFSSKWPKILSQNKGLKEFQGVLKNILNHKIQLKISWLKQLNPLKRLINSQMKERLLIFKLVNN